MTLIWWTSHPLSLLWKIQHPPVVVVERFWRKPPIYQTAADQEEFKICTNHDHRREITLILQFKWWLCCGTLPAGVLNVWKAPRAFGYIVVTKTASSNCRWPLILRLIQWYFKKMESIDEDQRCLMKHGGWIACNQRWMCFKKRSHH